MTEVDRSRGFLIPPEKAARWVAEMHFYPYLYRYAWGPRIKTWPADSPLKQLDRNGARCRVIARGAMNSALIEFGDGERAVVSRNALRKMRGEK